MNRTKELLAAGYVRDILFKSRNHLADYICGLERKKLRFKILEEHDREDGSVIIRILQQYNTAPLIQLYTE